MFHVAAPGLRVRLLRADELGAAEIDAWRDLEARAIEPNAYLSPHFVLPALRHLDRDKAVLAALVEAPGTSATKRLLALGLFVRSGPTRAFPLPHLVGYLSLYSALGGLLLDAEQAPAALDALFDFLPAGAAPCHGLIFHEMRVDGPLGEILGRGGRHRPRPRVLDRKARAALVPKETSGTYEAQKGASRAKAFRRRQKRLTELGAVTWNAYREPEEMGGCVERFLDLEHRGWKKEGGTSLRSTAASTAFFREVFDTFGREGRAFFTELSVGGRVAASTSNLISGRAGFAFKLGWDPSLARQAPGVVNEIHLILESPRLFPHLDWFDSGTAPGSFLEELWLERCELARVIVPLTSWAKLGLGLVDGLRRVRHRATRLVRR